jgi:hypothetical protein
MYRSVSYSVKLTNGLTNPFHTKLGVKQGCVLSPALFNIFMNELPNVCQDSCASVYLNNTAIPCLMYADDIVLLSQSAEGLQTHVNAFGDFCTKWHLDVNDSKTKIVIFNKGGKLIKAVDITYQGKVIEQMKSYKYLGVVVLASGSSKGSVVELGKTALKSIFAPRRKIYFKDISPVLPLKLYDSLVRPVLLYYSEVWGMSMLNTSNVYHPDKVLDPLYEINPPEQIFTRFCKTILGVYSKAINRAVRAELGVYPLFIHTILQMKLSKTKQSLTVVSYVFTIK